MFILPYIDIITHHYAETDNMQENAKHDNSCQHKPSPTIHTFNYSTWI